MIKKLLCALLSCAVVFNSVIMTTLIAQADSSISTVTLLPSSESPFGEFEGFGSSLCWWANRVGYSESLTNKAAELFFDEEKGLGLNIARYNIGGGDDPTHNHITRSDSKVPGYSTGYDDEGNLIYDWSQDENQRNMLNAALKSNPNLYVEAFSNSAPYFMTNSGCSSGATDPSKNNLKDDSYDDFAQYLTDVTKHFNDNLGIKFDCISPMNEPYTNYWGALSPKQEGCHFDQGTSQSTMFIELDKALTKAGLDDVAIVGTDETSIDTAITSFNSLSEEAKAVLDRIDTHTYSGSKRSALMNTAVAANKGLWMSEVDGTWTSGTEPYMKAGLGLANRIMTDINGMMPTAWVMWDIIDIHKDSNFKGEENNTFPTGSGFWGVGVADHDAQDIFVAKKYYAFGQFTKFVKPGSTIILSSDITNNLCAYDKDNGKIVIVASNTTAETKTVNYDLSQFVNVGSDVKVVRTSKDESWANLPDLKTSMKSFTASLSPNSITTFVVEPNTEDKEINIVNRSGYTIDGAKIVSTNNETVMIKKADTYATINADNTISFTDNGSEFIMESNGQYYKFKDVSTGKYLNIGNDDILQVGSKFTPPTAGDGETQFTATYNDKNELVSVELNRTAPINTDDNVRCFIWKTDSYAPVYSVYAKDVENSGSYLWDILVPSELSSITITPDKDFVYAGNTVNMSCTLLPDTAEQSVVWSVKGEDGTSDTDIASIDAQTGVLTTKNVGTVTVIAQSTAYNDIYSIYKIKIYGVDTNFTISNKNSGRTIQPVGRTTKEGASFEQWENLGYETQQYKLIDTGDGYYYIVNSYSNMAILADSSSSALTQTATYEGNDLAKWSFILVDGQYGKIVNKQTDKAIDVSGQSLINGGSVIQYAYGGGSNQQWKFTEFTGEPTKSLSITADSTEITIGDTLQMSVAFEPDNCETGVQWSVDNSSVAQISETGLLTGISGGTVKVTATSTVYEGLSNYINITVLKSGVSIVKPMTNNFNDGNANGFVFANNCSIATNDNPTPALFVQNKLNNKGGATGSGSATLTLAEPITCEEGQYIDIQFDMYCSNSGGTAGFKLYSGENAIVDMSTNSWTSALNLKLGETNIENITANISTLLRNGTDAGAAYYNINNGAHLQIRIDFTNHKVKLDAYNNTTTTTKISYEGTLPENITSLDKLNFYADYTDWTKYMIVDNLSTYILNSDY